MNRTMMKIAAAGALLLLAACGKDDEPTPPPSQEEPYTVYVAGGYDGFGCYWKDGELFTLPLPDGGEMSWTEAIEVYNGSVYVFGTYRIGTDVSECLWKDGNLVELNMDHERNNLEAFTISDGKICFGGSTVFEEAVSGWMPCWWIDGVQRIYDEPADARFEVDDIFVCGDKVYMCGRYWVGDTGRIMFCYWIDGKLTLLGEPSDWKDGIRGKIVVSKGRVCVLGQERDNKVQLWIDDNLREYEFPQGVGELRPESLCMAPDGSIYILGSYTGGACWWDEAGNRTDLQSVVRVHGIAAAGGSVYIAGISADNTPCYWKDGVRFDLPTSENPYDVEINDICLVKK